MVASGLRSRHVQFLLKGINHRLRRPQPLCLPQTGSYLDVSSRAKCYSTAAFFLGEKYGLGSPMMVFFHFGFAGSLKPLGSSPFFTRFEPHDDSSGCIGSNKLT